MGVVTNLTLFAEIGVAAVAAVVSLILALRLVSPSPRSATEEELHYADVVTNERRRFPNLLEKQPFNDAAGATSPNRRASLDITLSVIVPAYNETVRLPTMLEETLTYLDKRATGDATFNYEIVVVDDGSKDATSETARKVAKAHSQNSGVKAPWERRELRVLTLRKNRGKGGAVTQGMLAARGRLLLFADADGATKFADIEKLEGALEKVSENGLGVAVGSRAHMVSAAAVVQRSFIRNFLMHGFHTILLVLGISSIKDTQCGFKLLTRPAAQHVFPNMHAEGWIFDIELLLIALSLRIPVVEVPVNWHEVEGTKMSLMRDSVVMLIDLLVIRANYVLGFWRVKRHKVKDS